jgi:hypothetical protein
MMANHFCLNGNILPVSFSGTNTRTFVVTKGWLIAEDREMSLQQPTRISVMVSRRSDVSEEEFHRYWANNHGPLVQDMLVQYGIIKYTQVCGNVLNTVEVLT